MKASASASNVVDSAFASSARTRSSMRGSTCSSACRALGAAAANFHADGGTTTGTTDGSRARKRATRNRSASLPKSSGDVDRRPRRMRTSSSCSVHAVGRSGRCSVGSASTMSATRPAMPRSNSWCTAWTRSSADQPSSHAPLTSGPTTRTTTSSMRSSRSTASSRRIVSVTEDSPPALSVPERPVTARTPSWTRRSISARGSYVDSSAELDEPDEPDE